MKDSNPDNPRHDEASGDRGKPTAVLLSLAMIIAVLWPLQENWRDKPRDNFPLSYYPMFSSKREAIETFYYLVGRDQQGTRYLIPYKYAGSGGLNQVRRQIRKIVQQDRAPELARSVARRLARNEKAPWSNIVSVAVCRGRYSVDDYFHGRKDPVQEQVKASSPVTRRNE